MKVYHVFGSKGTQRRKHTERACEDLPQCFVQGLQAPSPVSQSANDQVWRDEELARALQVKLRDCLASLRCLSPELPVIFLVDERWHHSTYSSRPSKCGCSDARSVSTEERTHRPISLSLQAQLNAESSTRSTPGWLLSEGREAQSPSAAREVSWAQVWALCQPFLKMHLPDCHAATLILSCRV